MVLVHQDGERYPDGLYFIVIGLRNKYMAEVLIISGSDEILDEPPISFITALVNGEGGYIKIEAGCSPPKLLWTLKSLMKATAIGFQWHTIKRLIDQGMHGERAEAHVTDMLNKLVASDIPPLPNREDMNKIRKQLSLKPEEPAEDFEEEDS